MASAKALTGEELALDVETKLVKHYLSTAGSGGATSLTHIDASQAELAEGLGITNPDEAVQLVLDACGGDWGISDFLAYGSHPYQWSPDLPGYFRFLLLTCVVVASADDNEETQEFSKNLQRLCRTRRSFGNRQALPRMWNRLVDWCESSRLRGQPVRRIVLPPFDRTEPHIGLTNAISFPSWRDTRRLQSVFERSSGRCLVESPRDAALRLCPVIKDERRFSLQMRTASEEFNVLYRERASLLATHRFWAAVCRALQLKRPNLVFDGPLLRAEFLPGQLPEESRVVFLQERTKGSGDATKGSWTECLAVDAFQMLEAMQRSGSDQGRELMDALRAGALPFVHERFGVWISSLSGCSAGDQWIYLVDRERAATVRRLAFAKLSRLNDHWWLVEASTGDAAMHLHQVLGLHARSSGTQDGAFRLRGGVKTPAGHLGRTTLLPWLEIDGSAEISIASRDKASVIDIQKVDGGALLASHGPLDGQYELSLENQLGGRRILSVHRTLRFVADAPQHPSIRVPATTWRDRRECRDEAWIEHPVSVVSGTSGVGRSDSGLRDRFDDLLELIYARGASGWAERDLVDAVRELVPGPSPWDVLRTLQESGWLRSMHSISWRANTWRLMPPHLLRISLDGGDAAVLCGSASAAIRGRFSATTAALGGFVTSIPGIGPLSPVTAIATNLAPDRLADELAWPVGSVQIAASLRAPGCWESSPSGLEKHELYAEWHWRAGSFRTLEHPAPAANVEIRWWRRSEGDRGDLFSVDGGAAGQLVSASRTVALVEAFRRAREPMFTQSGGMLLRLPVEGHLPLHLAQTLHVCSLTASGLVRAGNEWRYAYSASAEGMKSASYCLGRHFFERGDRVAPQRVTYLTSTIIGFDRHRGARATSGLGR